MVALLSQMLAEEVVAKEQAEISEDLESSKRVRKQIESGEMKLLPEEEYWKGINLTI